MIYQLTSGANPSAIFDQGSGSIPLSPPETSGTNPDLIYEEKGQGGPSAWGLSWSFFWGKSWGFVRVTDPFRSTSGTSPELIYEEN